MVVLPRFAVGQHRNLGTLKHNPLRYRATCARSSGFARSGTDSKIRVEEPPTSRIKKRRSATLGPNRTGKPFIVPKPARIAPVKAPRRYSMDHKDYERIESDPEFRALVAAKIKFVVPATDLLPRLLLRAAGARRLLPGVHGDEGHRRHQPGLPVRAFAVRHGVGRDVLLRAYGPEFRRDGRGYRRQDLAVRGGPSA